MNSTSRNIGTTYVQTFQSGERVRMIGTDYAHPAWSFNIVCDVATEAAAFRLHDMLNERLDRGEFTSPADCDRLADAAEIETANMVRVTLPGGSFWTETPGIFAHLEVTA